ALDTDIQGLECAPQSVSKIRKLGRIGKSLAKTELSLEDAFRPGEASACEHRRGHAAFAGFAEMEPLDHRSFLAAGEFDQAAGVGTGDAERVDHLALVQTEQPTGGHRRSE